MIFPKGFTALPDVANKSIASETGKFSSSQQAL